MWYDKVIKNLGIIEKEVDYSDNDAAFKALWTIGQLCNTATFVYDADSTVDMIHQKR